MDETQKEQIISAIYLAIQHRNYRCARTILDVVLKETINETLDKTIALTEHHDLQQLKERIRELKYSV